MPALRTGSLLPSSTTATAGELDDFTDVRDEILDVIEAEIDSDPRSRQIEIGPSELGTPCRRKLAYKLAGTPRTNLVDRWSATIGKAVHRWLEQAFGAHPERFLVEARVSPGEIAGVPVYGSCDLFHLRREVVVDHKVLSDKGLDAKRLNGAGQTYRVQGQLYGLGLERAGYRVRGVAVFAPPRMGRLREGLWWGPEPYRREVAEWALGRANQVADELKAGRSAESFPTADDFCSWCPFFTPDPVAQAGCAGHRVESMAGSRF